MNMLGGNAPALDSNGLPVDDLVAKFADIIGTREMGKRLVLAAAILATKTKAISNPTLYFATQRQLSVKAMGNAVILFDFHFAQHGFAAPHV
ncbi:MAG: hypothetical protein HQL44_13465 [Alphaproteobacteria bacterium]|nr:hypothetical protein [Alphaproteobacteria bacterium]